MTISESITHMSKLYLDRVLGSFSKDINKFDEAGARSFIEKNCKEIKQPSHIKKKLDFSTLPYKQRLVLHNLVIFILLQRKNEVEEVDLYEHFMAYQKDQLKKYKDKEILGGIAKQKVELFKTLYEVVFEDDELSVEEERILQRLKKKIGMTEIELQAVMNTLRSVEKDYEISSIQFESLLKELQSRGLLYYLNKDISERKYIIPDEFIEVIAKNYHYPMNEKSFTFLFDGSSKTALVQAVRGKGLRTSGSKEELIDRLWAQGYGAEELLETFSASELSNLVSGVVGLKKSGTKEQLTKELLQYFFRLDTSPIANTKTIGESDLWEYFGDIGSRNYALLREINIIKKDLEVEHLFEKLTVYAFKKLAGLKTMTFSGNNNPDGGVYDAQDGTVMLWDNKSLELSYKLPLNHQKQFLQYVIKSKKTVGSFLVITGKIEDEGVVEQGCVRLSGEAKINIAVVTADVFKDFMDTFQKNSGGKPLNIKVFSHTGVLTNKILEMRLKALQ